MPNITFIGTILQPIKISVENPYKIEWDDSESNLKMEFKIKIKDSKIEISCETNYWHDNAINVIYMRAHDICKAYINLIGFQQGHGLPFVLHTFVDHMGKNTLIKFSNPTLSNLCTAYDLSNNFDFLLKLSLNELNIAWALNELLEAITLPHISLVNCTRAIERLKHLISNNEKDDKKAWGKFREILKIDEDYLKYITDLSRNSRHGRNERVSGDTTTEVTKRAWKIMNRYLEYKIAGDTLSSSTPKLE